ncbi:hypothetical protein VH570_17530 [Sphingobium sp. HT1-2]|uniref:hypothetical protein n=1 Tax=Sphingobium sp. HT1-2 TaxID=3111640 RepID=UPI003C03D67A
MTFAAFIISFADSDPVKRKARFAVHNSQLDEWLEHTDININVLSMGYREGDYYEDTRVIYHDLAERKASEARYAAFELFYQSDADWGIIMDNDATLYHDEQHNSAYKLIHEMDQQLPKYDSISMFVPIDPRKEPFSKRLARPFYKNNHAFFRHMDVKGSMVFVRNLRKSGEKEIFPDKTYDWCEDGKLAMDAVAAGHRVMQSSNAVLKEKGLSSSAFGDADVDRKPFMKLANERMVLEFGPPLSMSEKKPHLLDRRKWLEENWKGLDHLFVPKLL